jgi:hypothetical protein
MQVSSRFINTNEEQSKPKNMNIKLLGSIKELSSNSPMNILSDPTQIKVTPQLLKRIDFLKNTHFKLDRDVLRKLMILEQELRDNLM